MDRKIRILHMTPSIINNGIFRYIFTILKYIDREKFQFDFLMQDPQGLKQTKEYQKYHFGIHSFTTTQREDPKKFRQEIYDILSEGYDVLELHTSYWRGFMIEEIAMELGIPKVVVHSHSSGLDQNDLPEREKQLLIHEQLKEEFGVRYATDFWACSKEAGDWLFGEQIPREKIEYIHNAIETEQFVFDADVRRRKRQELGIENDFVIGHTGRFEYQKNHEFLIRVFAEVRKRLERVKLLLVGEGELMQETKALCEQLSIEKDVLFLGWRNDVNDLLQAMDVYVLPSRFEGLGISLVEAQTVGLKCVVSDSVPKEADLTDNFLQLPLVESKWAESLTKMYQTSYERRSYVKEVKEAGYDIGTEIKTIERMYMKGLEERK